MKLRKILLLVFAFISINLSSQILCEADSVCIGQDELYYSIDSSNIVYWDWIVPPFGTVTQNLGDSIYINWGSPGFYKVGLRVRDNQGCWSDTSWCYIDAIINSCALQVGINPLCVNHTIQQLPINILTGYPGGIWSGTGIVDSTKGEFHVSVAGVGSHVILYEQISGRCKVECNITITVTPGPLISPIYID